MTAASPSPKTRCRSRALTIGWPSVRVAGSFTSVLSARGWRPSFRLGCRRAIGDHPRRTLSGPCQGRSLSSGARAPTVGRRRSRLHGKGSSSAWPRASGRRRGRGRRRRPRPRRSSRSANVVTTVATTFAVSRRRDLDRRGRSAPRPLPDREPARIAVADRGRERGGAVAAWLGQLAARRARRARAARRRPRRRARRARRRTRAPCAPRRVRGALTRGIGLGGLGRGVGLGLLRRRRARARLGVGGRGGRRLRGRGSPSSSGPARSRRRSRRCAAAAASVAMIVLARIRTLHFAAIRAPERVRPHA